MAKFGTCLVSGATGFLGQRFITYLKDYADNIIIIGREPIMSYNFIYWDLNDDTAPCLEAYQIDTVFHLAGYAHDTSSRANVDIYEKCNALATKHLLDAAKISGAKHFLFVSSAKAGGEGFEVPVVETQKDTPTGVYGITKLSAEKHLSSSRCENMTILVLRPALMYGPKQKGNLAKMKRAISRGWFPKPPHGLLGSKSMVHVDDCVRALVYLRSHMNKKFEIFYLTDGHQYSPYDIDLAFAASASKYRIRLPKLLFYIGLKLPFFKHQLTKLYGSNLYSSKKIEATGFICAGSISDIDRNLF